MAWDSCALMRKSRLPRPTQRGMRLATVCRAWSDVSSQGRGCRMTSAPIQASKMSPARIRVSACPAACSRKAWKAAAVAGESGPRWTSEAIQMRPGSASLFNDGGFLDDDVFGGNILMEAAVAGLHALDLVDRFGAFHNLAEHGVAPAVAGGGGVIEEVVVGHVDEELRRRGVRVGRARHGNGVTIVLEAVVSFIFHGLTRLLLLHASFETPALDHEGVDHAVKDRAGVEAFAYILQVVGCLLGRLLGVQFDDDVAMVGLELDAGFVGHGGCTFCSGIGGCRTRPRNKQGRGEQGGAEPSQARTEERRADISHGCGSQVVGKNTGLIGPLVPLRGMTLRP